MNMDAVTGCDAVDAGNDWLRLRTASGALRTIPWPAVKIAGMGGNHEGEITIQGVTEIVTPLFATHDSLWLATDGGDFAQVMLEKTHPKRDQILAAFAQQLGPRWHGDRLDQSALWEMTFPVPASIQTGARKRILMMIVAMVGLIILAIVLAFVLGHHS
jgi:hypothetical protein